MYERIILAINALLFDWSGFLDRFNPFHLMFLMWSVSIISLKTYPRVYLVDGMRDSWIAMIVSSILIFVIVFYLMKVWKLSEEKNFVKIYRIAFGETVGNIFIGLFVLTLFLILVESAGVEADAMHNHMSIETPKWYYGLFFVLPAVYVVRRKLGTIISISIIGIILISIAGTNLGILTSGDKHIEYLFPIFENGVTKGFIMTILETLGLYGHFFIILPYLNYIEDKKNRLTIAVVIALIFVIQMEIVSTVGILMTFTIDRAITMNYPKLLQTQLVSFYQFFDFGELFVMLQTLGGWLLKYCVSFYAILLIFKTYGLPIKKIKISIYILSALVFVGTHFAIKNSFIFFRLLNAFQYVSLVNFVIIPFIAFVLLHIKIKLGLAKKGNS